MDTVLHRARTLGLAHAHAARYVAVGVLGTVLYYVALISLVEVLGVGVMASTCIAFILVVCANYLLHRVWTFRSPVAHRRAFIPFALMSVTGLGINSAVMALGLVAGMHYLFVQTIAIGTVVTWNYFFMTLIFSQPVREGAQLDERNQR